MGYKLTKDAYIFGGNTLTTTDCAVLLAPGLKIGNADLVKGQLTEEEGAQFKSIVQQKLEKIVDTMKTSPEDLPVVLVGGGAIISPDRLKGASMVLKPQWSQVANAIGAAIARVSAVVDTIRSTETQTTQQLLDEIAKEVVEKTVEAGGSRDSVKVVEIETLPLQVSSSRCQRKVQD